MSATARLVGGAALVAVGAVLSAYGFGAGTPLIGLGLSLSAGAAVEMLSPAPKTPGGSRGPESTVDLTIPPEQIIYGRTLVRGYLIFKNNRSDRRRNQADREYLDFVYIITRRRPVHALVGLYINDGLYELEENNGRVAYFPDYALIPAGTKYQNFIGVIFKRGAADDDQFTYLEGKSNNWGPTHKLYRICAAHVIQVFDEDLWPSGPPTLKFEIEGFELYDPRTDETAYSNNAALCVYDSMIGPHGPRGGMDPARISTASVIAAANVCDEMVETATEAMVRRYRCSGVWDATQDYDLILADLLASMAGERVRTGGSYEIHAGAPREPELSLSGDDLVSGVRYAPRRELSELANEIHSIFPNQVTAFDNDETPPWPKLLTSNPWRDGEDGGEILIRELQLRAVPYTTQAQRLQKIALLKLRQQGQLEAVFKPGAFLLKPLDVFEYSDDLFGWTDKLFECRSIGMQADGSVAVTAAEYDPAVYDWSGDDEQVLPVEPPPELSLTDDEASTSKNVAIGIYPLDNDEGEGLTLVSVTTPSHGTAEIDDDDPNKINYTPDTDYVGTDSFNYTASDGEVDGTATITVSVSNDNAVTGVDDFFDVDDDSAHNYPVLDNDLPLSATKTLTDIVTGPSHGTASIVDNKLRYRRDEGFEGTDTVVYEVTALSTTDTATARFRSEGGGGGGDYPSGLAWQSGFCDSGDDSTVSKQDEWADFRGRAVDILNFRANRKQGWAELISAINAKDDNYAAAYTAGIRVHQVMPLFPSGATAGSYGNRFIACANGAYDDEHDDIMDILATYDWVGQLSIRLGHECGSSAQADAYVHDPSSNYRDYRAAWSRIALRYKARFGSRVLLDWNNIQRGPEPRPAYPGDAAVDVISADCYGNNNSKYPRNQAEFLAYANRVSDTGAPFGPRSWAIYAQSKGKKYGVPEWAVTHPADKPQADCPAYIEGMFRLFEEVAGWGLMEYEIYSNYGDHNSGDHRLLNTGGGAHNNPLASAKYVDLWTP